MSFFFFLVESCLKEYGMTSQIEVAGIRERQ